VYSTIQTICSWRKGTGRFMNVIFGFHEGYILIHEGYNPVQEGYIPVHVGYISIYEGYIQEK
jgi:hypothetical protein